MAILTFDTVCVIDSYSVQVACAGIGAPWVHFGRTGDGPGEFRLPSEVFRGSGQTVGVFDVKLSRLEFFTPSGERVDGTPLPPLFRILGLTETAVTGSYVASFLPSNPTSSGAEVVSVERGTGRVLWRGSFPHPRDLGIATEAERGFGYGALGPHGEVVFGTGTRELVLFEADGLTPTVFVEPTYTGELPNPRDIDSYATGMKGVFGAALTAAQLDAFAATPKPSRIRGRALRFDDWGRLWVATERDRDQSSYLDVYDGHDLVATVRVRDRLIGFDIVGDLLAVLVERPEGELIPHRAVDIYRIPDSF